MKLVKDYNGKLVWIDTEGFREPTQEELTAHKENIAAIKAEDEKRKRKTAIREQIKVLKYNLEHTDYKQAKWLDGALSEEDYAPIRVQRQEWRNKINELEEEYKHL